MIKRVKRIRVVSVVYKRIRVESKNVNPFLKRIRVESIEFINESNRIQLNPTRQPFLPPLVLSTPLTVSPHLLFKGCPTTLFAWSGTLLDWAIYEFQLLQA